MTTLNTRFVAYLPLLQPSMPPDPLPAAALVAEAIRRGYPTVPMQITPAGVAGGRGTSLTRAAALTRRVRSKNALGWTAICRNLAALLIFTTTHVAMHSSRAIAEPVERTRILKIYGTFLYVPEGWLSATPRVFSPPYDKSLPLDTVFEVVGSTFNITVNVGYTQPPFVEGYGEGLINQKFPRIWPDFKSVTIYVKPVSPESQGVFSIFEAENLDPIRPEYQKYYGCHTDLFGKTGVATLGLCRRDNWPLPAIEVTYEWFSTDTPVEQWPLLAARFKRLVDWLATPPDQRTDAMLQTD